MFATIPPPAERLLVFAQLPELGKVKGRLAALVGDERALAAYEAMLADTLHAIGPSTAGTEIEIVWAPTVAANGETLRRAFGERTLAMQTGRTLADRMAMAFSERFFFHRTQKIVAIGIGDPCLDRQSIDHAFALLDSCEWVIGPDVGGGCYLIGCRAAAFDAEIFIDIEWEGSVVLSAILAKIRQWGSTIAVLPRRREIETLEELRTWAANAPCGATALGDLIKTWS